MDHTVRAYILCHLLSQVKDKTLVGRFEERFFTLCFGHEIDQIIRSTSFTGSVGRDSTTFAFDEVTKKYNIDRKTMEERYQDAKLLLECAKVGGAGTLLTMENVMSYWRSVECDEMRDLLSFYHKKGLRSVEEQSRSLGNVAEEVLLRGCTTIGLTRDVIEKGDTPLTSWLSKTIDLRNVFTYATDIQDVLFEDGMISLGLSTR